MLQTGLRRSKTKATTYLYEFYPSVSETILQTAIRFAEDHVEITGEEKRIIIGEIFCFSTRVNLGRKNKYHHLLSQLCITINKNNLWSLQRGWFKDTDIHKSPANRPAAQENYKNL